MLIGAVEAGGTKFVLAVGTAQGALRERIVIPTRSPQETFVEMAEWFTASSARHGAIGAFGIGSFGPIGIDPARGDHGIFAPTPKPGWSGASFHQALARFGVPFALDTDVNAAALGEWLAGAGRGCDSLAYTTVGTGIGTGVLRRGAILSGWSHFECGHLLVRRDPAHDPFAGLCAFHGDCLEGLASGPAITARWGHDLSSASEEQVALVAGYVAQLAATLVLMHRPERLIFGGGVMKAPGVIEALRTRTRAILGGYITEWEEDLSARIQPPGLGDDAGITGALELGRRVLETKQ